MAPPPVPPASESAGDQPEAQRPVETSEEAIAVHLEQVVSTHGPAGVASLALQPASESAAGQPRAQRPGETSGEALDTQAQQQTRPGPVSTPDSASVASTADQPTSEFASGQPETQRPDETSGEAFDASAQQMKLAEIDSASAADRATLRDYLRDPDPIIAAAAFDALEVGNERAAVEALLAVVNDPTEPVRLQALEILLGSPEAGEAVLAATLRAALQDPDHAFVARAVQELGGRADAEALSALAEALDAGDLLTRLLIVQSIASNTSDVPLLYQGLEDPDETVRSAATEILFPSKTTNTESAASR
jgi:DNA-binding phage protein